MSKTNSPTGMRNNKIIGIILLAVPSFFFIVFSYLMLFTHWDIFIIKLTLMIFVGIIVTVLVWMGYTMATAPGDK
jgi:hypothetical protein